MAKKGAMSRGEVEAITQGDAEMIERVAARIDKTLGERVIKIASKKPHPGAIQIESQALNWLQIQCHLQKLLPPRVLVNAINYALDPTGYKHMSNEAIERLNKTNKIKNYMRENPNAGVKEAARALGVNQSTTSRRKTKAKG